MADIAIDQTDIRTPSREPSRPARGRKTLLVLGGATLGLAVIGATGAAILSSIKLPSSLAGLAVLPKPAEPRRSEIRMGRLPDMPEIRDGVPAIVGTKPVRTVEIGAPAPAGPPKPVGVTVIPASTAPAAAALPTTFTTGPLPKLVGPAAQVQISSFKAEPIRETGERPAAPPPALPADPLPAKPAAAEVAPAHSVSAAAVASEPPLRPEPASTASVPNTATAVPLPPPAPIRTLARAPEPKPERPARASQVASRQTAQTVTPPPTEEMVPAPPPEDRIEILGVKLPNGRDLQNAVSSIGEALNLPKAF